MLPRRRTHQALTLYLALFALNVWICHRLFGVEFTHLDSNAGAFISISRFFRDHWSHLRWFPWFNGGMPIENAYQPVLPALTALISGMTGFSIGRSFHLVLAFAYCLGPVTLCWFVREWSESLRLSAIAGFAYSLISPAALLIPSLRVYPFGIRAAQRLYNLVHYGEGPHVLALTLLPVAFLFLRRAIVRRGRWDLIGAVVSCTAVAFSNAFGAVALALGALSIVLALNRGLVVTVVAGVAGWLLASPWLPPALLETIRRNAWTERGFYTRTYAAPLVLVLIVWLVWWATRRLASSFERFVWLFATWISAIPLAGFAANITLVPQAKRYQLEMEMALGMAFACLCVRALRSARLIRGLLIAALIAVFAGQAWTYGNFARDLIEPVEIRNTVEYKMAAWLDRNLPGQRAMVSGDAAFTFNVFSDNPQLSAGHEPMAPNFIQQIAVYQIYTGMNAGARDAEISIFWLKAFGNQAITVPGPTTREYYKPFPNPEKFEGALPVLWREDGDTIYGVPQHFHSLAHVIPKAAVVGRPPIHGLDIEPGRAYVAALDDPSLPEAAIEWNTPSSVAIRAVMKPGQVLAVQVTWNPAWRAKVGGRELRVGKDGLGLMVIEPECNGECEVHLEYGTTPEIWFCRAGSGLVALMLVVIGIRRSPVHWP